MKLLLNRDEFLDTCTMGNLFIDGEPECVILEDVDRHLEARGVKVAGKTAIPRGTYHVIINESARFKRRLPLLLQVPYFEGIRIHPGNTSADTEGCLLPGIFRSGNSVAKSRLAFDALFAKLNAAIGRGEEITIEVK